MPTLFLTLAMLGFVFALSAWFSARRIGALAPVYFLAAWLTGELALQHIAWQAVATVGFAAAGALSEPAGVTGLAVAFASWAVLLAVHARSLAAPAQTRAALAELGLSVDDPISPASGFAHPFRFRSTEVRVVRDVAYGAPLPGDKGRRNLLDVVLPAATGEKRPVLLQVHGGAWVIGDKEQQGLPLMTHLARRGWVSFALNYRLAPKATFPDMIVDVKRAIAWIRAHAREYGGDPSFVCVTGGSAGGHLSALAALSANDARFQPGFEHVDTRVAACVPFYGVYDFQDRSGIRGSQSMAPFLAKQVLKCTPEADPELWSAASPIDRISGEAPPFLVIHGTHDSLVWVEEAREFVRALRQKSQAPVGYLEYEGGQHAFDVFHSPRCAHAVRAAAAFLEQVHARTLAARGEAA
jgi:acetyl esterase/lipase